MATPSLPPQRICFHDNHLTYSVTLQCSLEHSKNNVVIEGRNFKVIGSDEAVASLSRYISYSTISDLSSLENFRAFLSRMSSPTVDKTTDIFKRAIVIKETVYDRRIQQDIASPQLSSPPNIPSTHLVEMSILGEIERVDIHAVINEICDVFEKRYVFPEVAKRCADYLRDQMGRGAYDGILDGEVFTQVILADLRWIAEDKHIDFCINPQAFRRAVEVQPLLPFVPAEQYAIPRMINPFHYKAKTDLGWGGGDSFPYEIQTGYLDQEHRIGYIDFRIFGTTAALDTDLTRVDSLTRHQAIIDAIQNINRAESIIVDLRNNGGGDPATVQLLCSLFIEEGLPLNTIAFRDQEPRDYATLPHTALPEELRLKDAKLFVLIGPQTFSAAEEFANNIKVLNRGTIIGELSAGGANPGSPALIGDGNKFSLFIPVGRAINPIQGDNWEGIGIIPDEFVPAEVAMDRAMFLITR